MTERVTKIPPNMRIPPSSEKGSPRVPRITRMKRPKYGQCGVNGVVSPIGSFNPFVYGPSIDSNPDAEWLFADSGTPAKGWGVSRPWK